MMWVTVSVPRRSGALNANDTAVFDTPAAFATSAIVWRRRVVLTAPPPPIGNQSTLAPGLIRFSKPV